MNDETDRVTHLETQVAFLQDSLDTLSGEFYEQQKTIDLLLLKINQLKDKVRVLDDAKEQGGIVDERPPHY